MEALSEPVCIINGAYGVYVPMVWAERYGSEAVQSAGVSADDVSVLLAGPDAELYWEAWESVLDSYSHQVNGVNHWLTQDCDLFEVPETYQWEES